MEDFSTEVESDVVGSFLASDPSDFGAVGVDCVWAPEMNECEAEIAAIFLAKKSDGRFPGLKSLMHLLVDNSDNFLY